MPLRTLGQLTLEGSKFGRVKPLLLLAYLAIEGPKPRRYLAEIFWPGASHGMNSLSVALSQLRRGAPGSIEADEARAWTELCADVQELREAFAEGKLEQVIELYRGPFLDGLDLELGEELEEWLYRTREAIAETTREALLQFAEAKAGQGQFTKAGQLAERAYYLPGAAEPDPKELVRFYALMVAGQSAALADIRRDAEAFNVSLDLSPEEARAGLRQPLVGREHEIRRLSRLGPGEWAWLRGASGMGKTALLKQLGGTYLSARAELPYATLKPLWEGVVSEDEEALLRRLCDLGGSLLLDDWEHMDPESQVLLTRLHSMRPQVSVVLTSKEAPPFPVDVELDLGPLTVGVLESFPGAWEQTGGLPELVEAYLREERLDVVLERRLGRLNRDTRSIFLALALLDEPDPALVRQALGLSGVTIVQALDELLSGGLIESSGRVRLRQTALHYLEAHPTLCGPLALQLARCVSGVVAVSLYRKAKALWDEADLEAVVRAYVSWGEGLLHRGFARRAVEALGEAPITVETTLLRARALERAGEFKRALEALSSLPEDAGISALKSALYWRLGKPDEAKQAAEQALEGESEARAEALNTLGVLARSRGDYQEAASYARRAAALWRMSGNQTRWVDGLNNLAIARALSGESSEETFQEAIEAANEHGLLLARTLLNLGWVHEREKRLEMAERAYREAARLADEAGVAEVAAWAWNNLGVLKHTPAQAKEARQAYEQALALAQRAGEQRILGMVMANLAELTEDVEAWEEALRILEKSGHEVLAESYRTNLPEDHVFKRHTLHSS